LAIEIERKFLIKSDEWRNSDNGTNYKQGYISTDNERTVRIRISETMAYLTIKGKSESAKRLEYEYEIPVEDAEEMLNKLCKKPIIEKVRYKINYRGLTWEVDEFFGDNKGLILAEVELNNEYQKVDIPDWVGKEVTGDPKYYNANLIQNPYKNWINK
jgi:CYTH domain-containing protein